MHPTNPPTEAPLILTLTLDPASFTFFNQLRQQHFPPARNFLDAHLTLFHHLPGAELSAITQHIEQVCQAQTVLPLQVSGVRFLGQGVAYKLENPQLRSLHKALQNTWQPYLTPQDQQPLQPHVTVQNKVPPAQARALHETLSATFAPFVAQGIGLQLWAYRGGPWEALGTFAFNG